MKEVFNEHFITRTFTGVDAAITMARIYQDEDNTEQATTMARRAQVLTWFEPTKNKANTKALKTLLEDLHLEPLDRSDTDGALLRELGVLFPEEESIPMVCEVAVGQPVMVRWAESKGLWGLSAKPLAETDEWQCVIVEMRDDTSSKESSNFTPPPEGTRLKQWRQSVMFGEGLFVEITVDRADDGRLRYTFQRVDS